ncbi:MAG: diguanylate cyclase [Rhodoferax sp.]|nr:diguanylate cyclase [Rhodoferax sp.]
MQLKDLRPRSIKTRVTLFILLIFVVSMWAVAFYASQMLRSDMQRVLGEQQYAHASALAAVVNSDLENRVLALGAVASTLDRDAMQDARALQSRLEALPVLQSLFNGGVVALDANGTAIADAPPSNARTGVNYRSLDYIATVLAENRPVVSAPIIGPTLKAPGFGIGVPIRDRQGTLQGVLAGVVQLDKPNFLDRIIQSFQGQTGGYLLVAPQQRLIITASDRSRVMEVLPPVGASPTLDRFIQGYEGSDVFTNPRSVEVLASAKKVPLTGWYVAAILPTVDAFDPIHDMQRRMLLATVVLTLLAAALTRSALRHELSPLLNAARALANLPTAGEAARALPVAEDDEVGRLIASFNHLVQTLNLREESLKDSEARFRNVMEQIPGVAVQGYAMDGTVTFWNAAAEKLYGYSSSEALGGNLLTLIIPPDMRDSVAAAMRHMAQTGEPIAASELLLQTKGGGRVPVFSSHALLKPPGQPLELFCVDIDLSDTKRAQEQVRQLAFYDALTGLPNRRLLGDRLNQTMAASKRSGLFAALMFLDLDNFKPLNDAHGHSVGDLLLVEVARRLCTCVREMDTVARFGGDEFVVMLGELETDRAQSTTQAAAVAEKIRTCIAAPYQLTVTHAGHPDTLVEHHCSASIGVVVFTNHEGSQADVLQWADAAMYKAKDAGRNTVRFHGQAG